jgi:hypothetical protein
VWRNQRRKAIPPAQRSERTPAAFRSGQPKRNKSRMIANGVRTLLTANRRAKKRTAIRPRAR